MSQKTKSGEQNKSRAVANAMVELLESVGKTIRLETHDGCNREGRVTSFGARRLVLNGVAVDLPMEMELNSDPTDSIPIQSIAKIDIDG